MLGEEVQLGLLRTASSWLFSWVSFYREQLEHCQATSFFLFLFFVYRFLFRHMPQGLVPVPSHQPWVADVCQPSGGCRS